MVQQAAVRVLRGDCVQVMREMPADSVDSVVTDPPYYIAFMGNKWDKAPIPRDAQHAHKIWAKEALRVLKPGGYLLAFGGTRTVHRLACAIEDAGFEIRDRFLHLGGDAAESMPGEIAWVYGSGFPKSANIEKLMTKAQGQTRRAHGMVPKDGPQSATMHSGIGSALKPAYEPIVCARKPLSEKNLVQNILKYGEWLEDGTVYKPGTGGLNIDASRVGDEQITTHSRGRNEAYPKRPGEETVAESGRVVSQNGIDTTPRSGRFPANLLLSHSEGCNGECFEGCPVKALDEQSGAWPTKRSGLGYHGGNGTNDGIRRESNEGGASRFFKTLPGFYCAKASKRERSANGTVENNHPTVKSLALMKYLLRLVTPENGTCLDPFAGSGTTGVAALSECFNAILIEQDEEYADIAEARIAHAMLPESERVEASKPAKARNTYGFKSTDVLRRCPEHNESIPSGSTTYKCGCAKVWYKVRSESESADSLF